MYLKTSKIFKTPGGLFVKFDLYRMIPCQPFNVLEKPAKYYCFYINQHAFNETGADFYKNYNAIENFHRISSSTNNQFFFLIEYRLELLENGNNTNNLKFRKRDI